MNVEIRVRSQSTSHRWTFTSLTKRCRTEVILLRGHLSPCIRESAAVSCRPFRTGLPTLLLWPAIAVYLSITTHSNRRLGSVAKLFCSSSYIWNQKNYCLYSSKSFRILYSYLLTKYWRETHKNVQVTRFYLNLTYENGFVQVVHFDMNFLASAPFAVISQNKEFDASYYDYEYLDASASFDWDRLSESKFFWILHEISKNIPSSKLSSDIFRFSKVSMELYNGFWG